MNIQLIFKISKDWLWKIKFHKGLRFFLLWTFFISFGNLHGFILRLQSLIFIVEISFLYICIIIFKLNMLLKITSLRDIVAVDYPERFSRRFELIYWFWSHDYQLSIALKIYVSEDTPLLSLSSFFRSSFWLEREIWDMFGLRFLFHKNLRRILTDYGFIGYPLRKDFPLIGFIETRYEDILQSIILEPIELSQSFRFFRFLNPWGNWT